MKKYLRLALALTLSLGLTYSINVNAVENQKIIQKTSTVITGDSAETIMESADKLTKTIHKFIKNSDGTWHHTTTDVIKNSKVGNDYVAQSHILTKYTKDNTACSSEPQIYSCAKKSVVSSYLTANNSQLIYQSIYNNSLVSKKLWLRNSKQQITEQQSFTYYSNGQIKKYEKLYGGKKLSTSHLSFNKSYVRNNNDKGLMISNFNYENSLIWNGAANNVMVSGYTYYYHSNNKLKQINAVYRSAKYNKITSKQFRSYYGDGKRSKLIAYSFNLNGSKRTRLEYKYNKLGQLKSNGYGYAYKNVTSYRNNRAYKIIKIKYTSTGKARRV